VKFHEEAEKEPALNDEARAAFTALEHGDPEITELWRWFIEISIAEYKKTYKQLDIEFDYYTGESFYTDKMPAVVEELKEKGLLTLDDGASIVDLEQYGMPPCLILKRDGSTLYPTRDIAAAIYRKNTFDFDKCIYVTSAGQCLHFAQWFKVLELMGREWYKDLVHVPYGTVSLNGEKLATRTGNVVLLKDLFAEAIEKAADIMKEKNPEHAGKHEVAEAVGVGAVVFYYLSSNRMRDINFVLEDALNFDGNTGPYAQYTYARTCAIIKKAEQTEEAFTEQNDDEFALTKTLALFPETFDAALSAYEPSLITRYALDLCAAFNRFYHNCKVLTAEDEQTKAQRIALVKCTNKVLASALELICVKHPEKI
jgi:arginyl-tRNA synthetase